MSKRAILRERRRRQRQRTRMIYILSTVGAAVVLGVLLILPNLGPVGDFVTPEPKSRPMVNGSTMGNPDAPVVMEEYFNYLCSYCREFHDETLDLLGENYIATGKVYFVSRQFPFSDTETQQSAIAAVCAAQQDLYWEYSDILFANQDGGRSAYTTRRLEAYAEAIGMDIAEYRSCIKDSAPRAEVQASLQTVSEHGISQTPSFLINGKLVVGALPYEQFQSEIEAALAQ